MNALEKVRQELIKDRQIPKIAIGDKVKVHLKIVDTGDKERIQIFEGTIIKKKNAQNQSTFTVRKLSYGVGVERIFPLYSPRIDKVEVISHGTVRRAKLYYLRELQGKEARLKTVKSYANAKNTAAPVAKTVTPETTTA